MDSPIQSAGSPVSSHKLIRLLTDLQVGIRKYSMYSGSHAIIPQMVASLTAQYHEVLGSQDALQVGVTKDEILYQGAPIASGNPVVRELARLLNQLNVAGATFRKEAAEPDIHGFLRVLAECRGLASPEERERSIERFCQAVPSIAFQFISFQGAVTDRDAHAAEPAGAQEAEAPHLWRGLVNRLMAGEVTGESRATLWSDNADTVNAEQLAAAINLMGLQRKTGEQSYERTIVSYLHEKATATPSGEQRAQMNQQLHRLFNNLSPEVRQRLFRAALDPEGQETTAAEALTDALPAPMLVEILEQLQVSNSNVSMPTFSLLKKFVTLAESDQTLAHTLETKLSGQKDLLQELLTKRAERTFYPAQYRALLDEEFAERAVSSTEGPSSGVAAEFDDTAVDHHLALILLEMLEAPIRSTDQFTQTVSSLKESIARGIGDHTSSVFNGAIAILGKRYAAAADDQREFFRTCVANLFQADFTLHLLGPLEAGHDYRQQREVLAELLEIIGPSIIPLLLDALESEQNLKARKRLLAMLRDCGDAVVPLAIQRLLHAQWYVVRNMLLLLRDLVAVKAIPDIVRCLQHASPQVRLAAFQTLGALAPDSDGFLKALKRALDDDDPKVFRAAVTQIVSAPTHASLELAGGLLVGHPGGKRGAQQVALLRVIEQIGTSAMLPLLTSVTRHHLLRFWTWRKTRSIRSAAARALTAIRKREGTRADSSPGPSAERPAAMTELGTDTSPEAAAEPAQTTAHGSP